MTQVRLRAETALDYWGGGVGAPLNKRRRGHACYGMHRRSLIIEPFNITSGTATIAIPSSVLNSTVEVPIKHVRPYVPALDGTPWVCNNSADAIHPKMLKFSET